MAESMAKYRKTDASVGGEWRRRRNRNFSNHDDEGAYAKRDLEIRSDGFFFKRNADTLRARLTIKREHKRGYHELRYHSYNANNYGKLKIRVGNAGLRYK